MTGIADMLVLGFLIGLTGALAPGPTLVAAINASVKGGWTAGPKVTFGHMAVETLVIVLVVAGLSVVLTGYSSWIAAAGGIALVAFGVLTLRGARDATIGVAADARDDAAPVIAGLVTSISNPYFWIWWLTVGSALLIGAMQGGPVVMLAFIAGHWGADLSWYTLVSAGIHKGRFFLSVRGYRAVLAACGIFLIGFGLWYLSTAFR
jgi:threonine/homoserine/homoserine lactone efflux protein